MAIWVSKVFIWLEHYIQIVKSNFFAVFRNFFLSRSNFGHFTPRGPWKNFQLKLACQFWIFFGNSFCFSFIYTWTKKINISHKKIQEKIKLAQSYCIYFLPQSCYDSWYLIGLSMFNFFLNFFVTNVYFFSPGIYEAETKRILEKSSKLAC